jgi:hypothetical protein
MIQAIWSGNSRGLTVEALRYFQRAITNFGVIGAMNGPFDRPRDDLLRTVILRGVFDNPVAKQRPVLHQSEHTHVPPKGYCLAHDPPKCERFGVRSWN